MIQIILLILFSDLSGNSTKFSSWNQEPTTYLITFSLNESDLIKSDVLLTIKPWVLYSHMQTSIQQDWNSDQIEEFFRQQQEFEHRQNERKSEMRKEISIALFLLSIVSIFFFIVLFKRRNNVFKIDSNDPDLVLVGKKRYRIFSYTGIVTQSANVIITETSTQFTENHVNVYSRTNENERFMILDSKGLEHAVDLQNTGIRIRPGNNVSAFWIAPEGRTVGRYVCFINHDTINPTYIRSSFVLLNEFSALLSLIFGLMCVSLIGLFMNIVFGEVLIGMLILLSLLGFGIFILVSWSQWRDSIDRFISNDFRSYIINFHSQYQLSKKNIHKDEN